MGKPTGFLEFERKSNVGTSPLERIKNYKEFHTPLPENERRQQASRCMDCGVPFCQNGKPIMGMVSGCPLNNLVPEWNDLLYTNEYEAAAHRLLMTNNFPEFTSRVCPALCEAACTCGLNGNPVSVKENENFIIEFAYNSGLMQPNPPKVRTDKNIAIIGSGPSGLACADQLNKRGHNVTVFEKDDRIGYFRQAEMTYTNEFYSGFSFQLTARTRKDESSYLIPFLKKEGDTYTPVKDFSVSAAELKLRYAPNEKFFQTQWNRFPVSLDAPVFTLSHTIAGKGVLGSDYTYNHTEAGIQKRFWFSAFGYTDVILKAGKVWDKVPFPLLIMPNANLSYTIQPESYSLMNAMEFMNDEYFSWDVTYFLNGWLFNRVPLLKKLKWREIVSCRGLYGHLSDKNNPALSDGLFAFPIENTQTMGKTPYVEAGVGIENIFKVLRLDYIWRLTYRDSPGIDRSGLRISLHMTF